MYVHGLLRDEVAADGAENVVLWGTGQGSETSLVSMLLWEGKKIAAWVGRGGWMPLPVEIEDAVRAGQDGDTQANQHAGGLNRLVVRLREIPKMQSASIHRETFDTPAFLDLVEEDKEAQRTAALLRVVGADVACRMGKPSTLLPSRQLGGRKWWWIVSTFGAENWYSGKMIGDIVEFLQNRLGSEEQSSLQSA